MSGNKKTIIACAITFAAAVIITVVVMTAIAGSGDKVLISKKEYQNAIYMTTKYAKAESLYQILEKNYYTDLNDDDLMSGIYKGLMSGTHDLYTAYYTADEYSIVRDEQKSSFFGIGIVMNVNDNKEMEIVSVNDNGPAEKAGMKPGDIIVSVDGENCIGKTQNEIISRIRGEKGTSVKISVKRDGELKEFKIKRAEISDQSVYSEIMDDNIGYIRITSFMNNTAEEFKSELEKMEASKVKGFVLDLRSNGGGLVDQSVKIADMLVDDGLIFYAEDRFGNRVDFDAEAGRTSLPYVVLVNGATASASEMLTTGIQKNKEGTVVGTKTFGKGIAQKTFPLKDGSALEITIIEYFANDGTKIHEKGITPDVVVEFEESDIEGKVIVNDRQLQEAVKILNKNLKK